MEFLVVVGQRAGRDLAGQECACHRKRGGDGIQLLRLKFELFSSVTF